MFQGQPAVSSASIHTAMNASAFHTFGLNATVAGFHSIQTMACVQALANAERSGLQPILIGQGSNTVFVSPVVERCLWQMNLKGKRKLGIEAGCYILRAMAGENWHEWVEWTLTQGYPGLENLALIPGTVGAAPVQNIGAYGMELAERIHAVHVWNTQTQSLEALQAKACAFAYRDSIFKQQKGLRYIIVAVDFAMPIAWQPKLNYAELRKNLLSFQSSSPTLLPTAWDVLHAVCAIRTAKLPDPKHMGNSGSFFKNPWVTAQHAAQLLQQFPNMPHYPMHNGQVKLAAGWLIEQCGFKGQAYGRVGVYAKQALVLCNLGQATGPELQQLVNTILHTVQARFGVTLEIEPVLI